MEHFDVLSDIDPKDGLSNVVFEFMRKEVIFCIFLTTCLTIYYFSYLKGFGVI